MASRTKQRYSSAEMAQLILAYDDENSDNFYLSSNSSNRDSDKNFEQTVLPPSDSDAPCINVSSSETESDEDGDLNGAGKPKARDILHESGPSNYVSTSIASQKTLWFDFPNWACSQCTWIQ